jgi:hypothetical protein
MDAVAIPTLVGVVIREVEPAEVIHGAGVDRAGRDMRSCV